MKQRSGQKLKISRLAVQEDGKPSSRKAPSDDRTLPSRSSKQTTGEEKRKKKSNSGDKDKKRKPRKKPADRNDSGS